MNNEIDEKIRKLHLALVTLAENVLKNNFSGIIAWVDKNAMETRVHFINMDMLLESDRCLVSLIRHMTTLGDAKTTEIAEKILKNKE
jgi:hypothetical protein